MLNTVCMLSCERLEAVSWQRPPPRPSPSVSTASISFVTWKQVHCCHEYRKQTCRNFWCRRAWPHLLLLGRRAAQQHVEQNMRQQVDCDLVVVFDDEATAGEHPAGQLMSHLKHSKSAKSEYK